MAHFANKIKTVYYEDSSYSTVCIEYEDDLGQLRRHSIPADPTNTDYKFLIEVEGFTKEDLETATEKYKKNSSKAMNLVIQKAAMELAEEAIEQRVAARVKELDDRLQLADKEVMKAEQKHLAADQKLKSTQISVDNKLWDALLEANENKDEIFKFKLWALEQEKAQGASAEQKKEFRKQNTLLDCITYFNKL